MPRTDRSCSIGLVCIGAALFLPGWIATAPAAPTIIKGPYLQYMTQTHVTIMWETDAPTSGRVHYLRDGVWHEADGPGSVTLHEIRIGGFQAGESVTYYVESANDLDGSSTHSTQATFRMAPPAGSPFRMCVWGDNQQRPEVFRQHVENMIRDQPDLLVALGDVVHSGWIYSEWDVKFLGPLRPLIQYTPMIVAMGNHDGNSNWFYEFLAQPGNEHWFTYEWGNAFFVVIDTNFPIQQGSEQYEFVEQALFSPEAQQATWLFVAHHHPGYSDYREEYICGQIRQHLMPLIEAAGVDVNFHGHVHTYERGEFVSPLTGRRIWQVQTSGGGGSFYPPNGIIDWDQIDLTIPNTYHYCVVDVGESELSLRAIGLDGLPIDQFVVPAQPRGAAPGCVSDVNADGRIDVQDLSIILSNFGTERGAGLGDGDIDGNGAVDLADLSAILAQFGIVCR